MRLYKLIILIVFLGLTSCYYDVEEELYPSGTCQTDNVTYSVDILDIIQTNCYACHDQVNSFGSVNLEGYTQVKQYVDNGQLLGVIRHDAGFSPMPKGGNKLLDCEIAKVEAWIEAGALDN